jgi:hypothetical protein
MSKTCEERRLVAPGAPACGLPAMTRHDGRWVCFGCRERLEQAAKRPCRPTPSESKP